MQHNPETLSLLDPISDAQTSATGVLEFTLDDINAAADELDTQAQVADLRDEVAQLRAELAQVKAAVEANGLLVSLNRAASAQPIGVHG